MELYSNENDACKTSELLAVDILRLALRRSKLIDNLKSSDIQALKSCVVAIFDLSVMDGWEIREKGQQQGEKSDAFSALLDVLKFCKYILDGNEKYEVKPELKDEVCSVLKMAVSSLLKYSEDENCWYQQLHELFISSINRLKQRRFLKEANFQSLHDIKQIGLILGIIESVPSDKHKLFFHTFEPDLISLCQETQTILRCADVLVASHLMTYIIPQTLQLVNKTKFDIISETWKTVTSFFNTEFSGYAGEEHCTAYLILCCLVEYCFPAGETRTFSFPIHENEVFWSIIQQGLVHDSTIVRKRTMYVLKKVLLWCDTNSLEYICKPNKDNLFCWNSDDANQKTIWENITIVFETLEEKQVHVIKPLLSKVDDLIKQTNGKSYLHPSWVMEVLHRMLNHENKFIIKWALFRILEFQLKDYPDFIIYIEKFIPVLIKSLNDASLYSRSSSSPVGSCSSLGLAIKLFFHNCYSVLSSIDRQVHYFSHVLSCMHKQSWGGVALMYISYALSQLPPTPLWDETSIDKIKDLILNSLRTQDVLLRGAVQCYLMKAFLNLINASNLSFDEFSKLLFILKRSESLHRGTQLWTDVAEWINKTIAKNCSHGITMNHAKQICFTFLKNSLNVKGPDGESFSIRKPPTCNRMARLIVLLADACSIFPDAEVSELHQSLDFPMNDVLQPIINVLGTALNRPYISHNDIIFCLEFISSLLAESKTAKSAVKMHQTDGTGSRSDVRHIIKNLLSPHLSNILILISDGIIKGFAQLQHIENITVYLKAFKMLIEEEKLNYILPVVAPFVQQCSQIISSKQTVDTVIKQKSCWSYLACIFSSMGDLKDELLLASVQNINHQLIETCINLNILDEQTVKPPLQNDKVSQKAWRCFLSNSEADQWKCIDYYLTPLPVKADHRKTLVYLTKQATKSLDIGSHESVIPIFLTLKKILPLICEDEEELFVTSLQRAWKACNEFRKNELFKPAVEAFIQMMYHPVIMASPSLSKYLNEYSSQLMELTETNNYGFLLLIEHCCSIWKKNFCVFYHMDILCSALTFGPIYRKDQRIINDAAAFIASHGSSLSINQLIQPRFHLSSIAVRITAINFLRMISPSVIEHQTFAQQLVLKLISEDIHISSTKSRHFGNSLIHRVKTRAWQSIFLLESVLSKENKKRLLETVYCLLIEENHQPSVRYLLEWLAVKILIDCKELQDGFMDHFQNAAKKRIGSVVSFLSIVIHVCAARPLSEREEYFLKWIPLVIPWAMGQNFNTRIYAQLALMRFFLISRDFKFNKVLNMYGPLFSGIQAVDSGNITKNTEKLSSSFYFSVFHPLHHCSLETVFYDLPRLSMLTDEEWISPHLFAAMINNSTLPDSLFSTVPVFNADSKLRDSEASSWVLKTSDALSNEGIRQDELEVSGMSNFQKKITPWKQVIPDLEALQEIGSAKKQWIPDGLVVVASLIDRAPNLGGLCRTCEVFGVSEYVLGSIKYTEDKQFQNLCVSADKWVSLREVKPHCLKEYLLEMKEQGYTLIGVEQTDHSQSLQSFAFPQQSLLLLGNEKEGLPTNLIHLLDICVEIPQCGIIRSLNVHVSGAILIWEYARQHNFAVK